MPTELDDIDRKLVELLAANARTSNAQLAEAVGVAPSTAHSRLRMLQSRGIIVGYHAALDQAELGRGLQAIIHVSLRAGARQESIREFAAGVRQLPDVIQLYFVGGMDDFMVHIAVEDSSALRRFVVDHLSSRASVASTRTSIIFEYHRNAVAADFS
ncbi:AsnC family transcriptional regulator [Microbacterium mangrovi]|uniref:AsnC family transcriptional regulator n=1 Tax=Microbacterium mangrovi TaxID=1348253 RepID=A0A0B2ACV8_9MICO|nr:Lrp/AsnC family transcriptional regulator [Microbacterium mangrovi]KHK99598.1 AsnC family transcriptional regulator [Microbacterium mangrovi]